MQGGWGQETRRVRAAQVLCVRLMLTPWQSNWFPESPSSLRESSDHRFSVCPRPVGLESGRWPLWAPLMLVNDTGSEVPENGQ